MKEQGKDAIREVVMQEVSIFLVPFHGDFAALLVSNGFVGRFAILISQGLTNIESLSWG